MFRSLWVDFKLFVELTGRPKLLPWPVTITLFSFQFFFHKSATFWSTNYKWKSKNCTSYANTYLSFPCDMEMISSTCKLAILIKISVQSCIYSSTSSDSRLHPSTQWFIGNCALQYKIHCSLCLSSECLKRNCRDLVSSVMNVYWEVICVDQCA